MRPLLKTADGWELQHPPSLLAWLYEMDGREDACVVVDSVPKVFYFATEGKRAQAEGSGRAAKMFHDLIPLLDLSPVGPDTPGWCDKGRRMGGCEPWAVCSGREECGGNRLYCGCGG